MPKREVVKVGKEWTIKMKHGGFYKQTFKTNHRVFRSFKTKQEAERVLEKIESNENKDY